MQLQGEMRRRLRDGRDGRALVEELERMGEALGDASEKSHWLLELGVACEMLVPERQRALGLYCRAAELDGGNLEAIERGRMVSRELGRIDELIRLTELDLRRESDEARREHLSAFIGESLLDLGDRQRAAGFLVGAAGQFPSSLAIQDALGTVGYDDDWRAEVERLIAIEKAGGTHAARVALRAARVLGMEAPADPRYEQLLHRVLVHDAYDESAHMLLDALYAAAGRWDELEDLQATLVQAFPGADEQAALCQRFSFAWIARGQHERAAAWFWRAIELGHVVYPIAGLTMLRGVYGPQRHWDRLLAAIDALLDTPLDEDAAVHAGLLGGTIAWKAIHDRTRAAGYFDRVRQVAVDSLLLIDFDDASADERAPEVLGEEQRGLVEAARRLAKSDPLDRHIEAWKRAIAVDPSTRAPRRGLARVLHVGERWRTLAEALKDEEANACRDDAGRVALLMQLAALYRDRLRQDLLATATLQRVLELDASNLGALNQLEQAYRQAGRWPDVVAVLGRKLGCVHGDGEKLKLHLELADLWNELGNEAESVKAMEAALAVDQAGESPGGEALRELDEKLERAYVRRREWDKLFALKQRRTETLGDATARLEAYLELAQLASDKLKKPPLAISAWQAVLALDGTHEAALAALERLYAAGEAHAPLADIYERRAAQTTDPAARLGYLQKLAALCMAELGDPERAMSTWLNVLALSPGNTRALEMLRRLYVDQRAWDALEALFAPDGRLDDCARLFERTAADEPLAEQVELWLRAGRLWQRLGKRVEAQRAFEKVLQLHPNDGAAVGALVALYEEGGDARKLAGALALQLGHDRDEVTRKARLLRLAGLHARDLHDPPGAFRWQLEAFTVDPGDLGERAELERLAARTSGWAPLIERYLAVAPGRPEAERVALWSTAAREQETLGDGDGALATWRLVLAVDPPPAAALEALARLYEARGAWHELHDVYARKLSQVWDADTRRPIVVAMAALAERTGDDTRAIADYQRLVDELGPEPGALEALERLHERQGNLAAVERVLAGRLALPGQARAALTYRLGDVRQRLGRVTEAIALYGQVLDEEPGHPGARGALEALADDEAGSHRLQAALLLEPFARATSAAPRLCAILRLRIADTEARGASPVSLMHELSWLQAHELGRVDEAFATLAEALRLDPLHPPTYDALEQLSHERADWEGLASLYKEIAGRPLSVAGHIEVRCRLGAVYRDRLGALDRARATWARVLDLAPEHDVAMLQLAGLCESEPAEAARAVDLYATLVTRERTATTALLGLERLFSAGVERGKVAALLVPRYRQAGRTGELLRLGLVALEAAPDDAPLDELAALARAAGALGELRAALVAAGSRARLVTTRAALALTAAGLELEVGKPDAARGLLRTALAEGDDPRALRALAALVDDDEALALLERLLVQVPDDGEALAALAALYERRERWDALATVLERQLAAAPAAAVAPLVEQRAMVLTRLGDHARAADAWRQLAALRPGDPDPLRQLVRRLRAGEQPEPLAEALVALAGLLPADDGERLALYLELGALREAAGQPAAAIEAYEAALALDDGCAAALARLEDIHRQAGAPALLDVLERRAELIDDRDEQRHLYRQLADEAMRRQRWARAVDAFRHAAALEPSGDGRGEQLYRAGLICRDHLAAFDDALTLLEAAADSYAANGGEPPARVAEALARLRAEGPVGYHAHPRR